MKCWNQQEFASINKFDALKSVDRNWTYRLLKLLFKLYIIAKLINTTVKGMHIVIFIHIFSMLNDWFQHNGILKKSAFWGLIWQLNTLHLAFFNRNYLATVDCAARWCWAPGSGWARVSTCRLTRPFQRAPANVCKPNLRPILPETRVPAELPLIVTTVLFVFTQMCRKARREYRHIGQKLSLAWNGHSRLFKDICFRVSRTSWETVYCHIITMTLSPKISKIYLPKVLKKIAISTTRCRLRPPLEKPHDYLHEACSTKLESVLNISTAECW